MADRFQEIQDQLAATGNRNDATHWLVGEVARLRAEVRAGPGIAKLWVICDRCSLKCCATRARAFMNEHAGHVFNGLRIMKKSFPCPNRQKRYAEAAGHVGER